MSMPAKFAGLADFYKATLDFIKLNHVKIKHVIGLDTH